MKFLISETIYNKNISELDLNTRAYNAMRRAKFTTIKDILDNQDILYNLRGVGEKVVREVKNKILEMEIERATEKFNN